MTIILMFEIRANTTYFNATPCLKPVWNVKTQANEKFDQSRVRLCSIKEAFDCVRLEKCLGEFDCVQLPNPIEINRTIEFDLVRLPNIRLTTPGTCI